MIAGSIEDIDQKDAGGTLDFGRFELFDDAVTFGVEYGTYGEGTDSVP